MFSLFGNHFDSREEHLLLSMFEIAMKQEIEAAADLAGYAAVCAGGSH